MTDESREKLESLRQAGNRFLGQMDEVMRPNPRPPDHWTHIEDNETRYLFYLTLAALGNLSDRITNLEDMLVWAPTAEIQEAPSSTLGVYRTSRDRGEDEVGAMVLQNEYVLIAELINGKGPVTEVDRANIAHELKRLLDRFVWTYNELGKLRGWPPVEPRFGPTNDRRSGDRPRTDSSPPAEAPNSP